MVVDRLSIISNCKWWHRKFYAVSKCQNFWLLKPTTYMNASGVAVKDFLDSIAAPIGSLIVVYDDVDLPCGKLRVRAKGSSGGHKGLESIITELGSQDFVRIRIGIGPRPEGISLAEFVLQDFAEEELKVIDKVIDTAIKAINVIVAEGVEKAMSLFNSYEVIV